MRSEDTIRYFHPVFFLITQIILFTVSIVAVILGWYDKNPLWIIALGMISFFIREIIYKSDQILFLLQQNRGFLPFLYLTKMAIINILSHFIFYFIGMGVNHFAMFLKNI